MPRAASRDPIYYRRRYSPEVIELCVRWYLTYRLSYRDLAAMMGERDVAVNHTTIMRWVQHNVPQFERCWARFSKLTDSSWRVDETAVSVRGRWNYLYRAVDRNGKSIHSLLCEDRTVGSAQAFFHQAVKVAGSGWPQKVNLDGNAASHRGLRLLGEEDSRWQCDEYRRPAGQRAIWRMTTVEKGLTLHRYWSSACPRCPMKSACTPSDYRRITRWEHEDVLERMQARLDRMPQAGRLRRQTLEHAFGTLKRMIQVFGVQPLIAAIRA